jgi:KDO2-lipid IV(A) lauroyltransferase
MIGPRTGAHRRADANLARAIPAYRTADRERILNRMWDHLGRMMGEFPHLHEFKRNGRMTVKGSEYVDAMRDDNLPGVFVGGHLGNWELSPIASAMHGVPMGIAFRNPNNPFVAVLLDIARRNVSPYRMAKGSQGGLGLLRFLKKGGHLGMLVDQKSNEGLKLKFFGMDAMTAHAAAQWALRLQVPLALTRVKRVKGAHFEVYFEPFYDMPKEETPETIAALAQRMNDKIESCIREAPSQWLWMHNRWVPDAVNQAAE